MEKYSVTIPFSVFNEPRQGLSYARERGFAEAQQPGGFDHDLFVPVK